MSCIEAVERKQGGQIPAVVVHAMQNAAMEWRPSLSCQRCSPAVPDECDHIALLQHVCDWTGDGKEMRSGRAGCQ